MKVIPAIDLLNGKVVRLKKGEYDSAQSYSDNPLDQAIVFKNAGFKHIHIVDLNGAKEGRFVNLPIISKIISETGLIVQSGGGIRTFDNCQHLFDAGINKIVSSSMAVKNEKDWIRALKTFGGDKCILGMDLKDGQIAYSGWTETASESTHDFLRRMISEGLEEVLCTDISRDGMLSGVNVPLYLDLMKNFPKTRFIASGGVSGKTDLEDLTKANVYAVVVGRAYYEGHLDLDTMQSFNN